MTDEQQTRMFPIGDALAGRDFTPKKSGPTSSRAALIDEICAAFNIEEDFEKVLFQTCQMTEREIRGLFDEARRWKINPPALFWKLVKEKRKAIRRQLDI